MSAVSIAVTARARMSVPRGSPTRCATTSAWCTATMTVAMRATAQSTAIHVPTPASTAATSTPSDKMGMSVESGGIVRPVRTAAAKRDVAQSSHLALGSGEELDRASFNSTSLETKSQQGVNRLTLMFLLMVLLLSRASSPIGWRRVSTYRCVLIPEATSEKPPPDNFLFVAVLRPERLLGR